MQQGKVVAKFAKDLKFVNVATEGKGAKSVRDHKFVITAITGEKICALNVIQTKGVKFARQFL